MHLYPAINPKADKPTELFVVYNCDNDRIIESQPTIARADKAVRVLRDHDARCGRGGNYGWVRRNCITIIEE